jgi:hypothetical protein
MIDWKAEISRMVYWKQMIADNDRLNAYPWHFPRVGATHEDVALAEKSVGHSFSPQYDEFLRHANGWQGFVVAIDLFGTKDFLDGRSQKVMQRTELSAFVEKHGCGSDEFMPIGASDTDLDVFLHFSPSAKTLPGGVLWFANEEVDRYESFADFFAAMVNYNARIAQRVNGGALETTDKHK